MSANPGRPPRGRRSGARRVALALHRTTLEKALVKAIAIVQKKGATVTDPVRDAVRRTLAAVPTDESPGRLTREPPAVGFSLLTGIKPRAVEPPRVSAQEEKRRKAEAAKARQEEEQARKEKERRERDIKTAEQALRDAERRLAELKG